MSEGKSTYKDTLNPRNTDFAMRAGLLEKEPAIQAAWKNRDLYGQIRVARSGAERFVLHDGPPYANGDIHMGTALNTVLKDIVVRFKTMTGFDAPFLPGWDCHGLPIEYRVQSEVGEELVRMSRPEIRRRCTEYADHYAKVQSEQFQRLGVLGEFDNPYITMSRPYESAVIEVFACMLEQGVVYRQLKPVHWSIENRTALAEAELEYQDREDDSIHVLFAAAHEAALKRLLGVDDPAPIHLMIWTTTPWTLPANRAVAVHPDYEYSAVKFPFGGRDVIAVIATELVESVLAAGGVKTHEVLATCRGAMLADAGVEYLHPLFAGMICPVVPAPYVTLADGTGLVHTAPGHGHEDYGTGIQQGLEIYCPVQEDGTFDDTAPPFLAGKTVWEANPLVVDALREAGTLFHHARFVHSYPHDWRSKTPTIFRATEQWFVGVDQKMNRGTTLRSMALAACAAGAEAGGMSFIPGWGRNRLAGMLESRPDWCLSRQRSWGLPIPAFYDGDGQVVMTPATVRAVAAHFARHGSDSWFTSAASELLSEYEPADDPDWPEGTDFHVDALAPGMDILDVWFESGSSWYAAVVQRGLVETTPVDLYLEGSDQHRGWFQLSLLPALAATGLPPCMTVLTHGFVVTEDGHKMSKSLGNAIDVVEQLAKRGADILRLWIASQNYQDDVRCSEKLIAQAEDAYRKIRNTLRFCMMACCDFDPKADAAVSDEHSLDRWMRMELHRLIRDVRGAYETYEFHRATRLMYEFCTVHASSIYMAAAKDRLYCDLPESPRRRATQTVLHEVLVTLIKLLAPILPHTAEEAWAHVPHRDAAEPDTPHLALMPEVDEDALDVAEAAGTGWCENMKFEIDSLSPSPVMIWGRLMDLRADGLVQLEALRNAGVKNPLDAEAVFTVRAPDGGARAFLQMYLPELEDLLGVGYARIEEADTGGPDTPITLRVADARDQYARCARSWKRRPDVGSDSDYPDLSARDAHVVKTLKSR